MASLVDLMTNPGQRARMAAAEQAVLAHAKAAGVDPNFALGLIAAESSGKPDAVGDGGAAIGLYQVHSKHMRDWGFDPAADVRRDPGKASAAIMPALRKLAASNNDDWGISHVGYVTGPNSKYVRALRSGVPAEQALAGAQPHVLGRYLKGREMQQALYGPNGVSKKLLAATTDAPQSASTAQGQDVLGLTNALGIGAAPSAYTKQLPPIGPLFAQPAALTGGLSGSARNALTMGDADPSKLSDIYKALGIGGIWQQTIGS